jgi:hypothetical protein
VRNCDDGSIGEDAAAQGSLQECVCLYINGSLSLLLAECVKRVCEISEVSYGCLVQDKDVAGSQQSAGEVDELALALTQVGACGMVRECA